MEKGGGNFSRREIEENWGKCDLWIINPPRPVLHLWQLFLILVLVSNAVFGRGFFLQ